MDETRIKDLLRRFQPVGPPPELQMFALYPARPDRVWPWATAAAALLAVSVAFHVAASRVAIPQARDAELADALDGIAAAFGGDAEARRFAELIVVDLQWRRLGNSDSPTTGVTPVD